MHPGDVFDRGPTAFHRHNAALAEVGLNDWCYEAMSVEPGRLAEAVAAICGEDFAGANVTVPHKEAIIDLTSWNWKGNGPYTITFVSKDASGNVISEKSVNITVFH